MVKLFLVEDHDVIREMIAERLKFRGYEVWAMSEANDIVAAVAREKPDLVIMDLSLPEVDGWAATGMLKAAPKTQAIPVIAMTAHAMTDDRDKALAAGCDEYETKPIDFERVEAKIRRLLDSARDGYREPCLGVARPEAHVGPPVGVGAAFQFSAPLSRSCGFGIGPLSDRGLDRGGGQFQQPSCWRPSLGQRPTVRRV